MSKPENKLDLANTTDLEQQRNAFERLDLNEIGLAAEDFEQVQKVQQSLNDLNYASVAEYGKDIATQTSAYTDELLDLVQSKELDETGQKLNQVVKVAQQLNTSNVLSTNKRTSIPVIGALLGRLKGAKQNFDQQFSTIKVQVETLVNEIEQSQAGLKSRVQTLDAMFQAVKDEHKLLGIYVAAGRLKQQHIQHELLELSQQPQGTELTQQIYDLNHLANNLEKRVSDLQVLQHSAMQTLPMIRIIQSNNLMLVDKFYAIKNITLPAWKNQMSLAVSLQEQKNAVELAKNIDDATNELLRRNAALLHQNSVDTARANQRSVIDVETLEQVQASLIETVNDVINIQKEGLEKRHQASARLRSLQQDLDRLVREGSLPSIDSPKSS